MARIKQGTIFMLEVEGIPKKHPCVLLGSFENNKYGFILFTSYKEDENGDLNSYISNQTRTERTYNFENLWDITFIVNVDKGYTITLGIDDGLKYKSQAEAKKIFFRDKNVIKNEKSINCLTEQGWKTIIDKYRDIYERNMKIPLSWIHEEKNLFLKQKIETIANFSYYQNKV